MTVMPPADSGKFNDVLDPGRARIPRPRYEVQLDQWVTSGRPSVLLGDEGLGKTWLFLSWWHARINAAADLPLTLLYLQRRLGRVRSVN